MTGLAAPPIGSPVTIKDGIYRVDMSGSAEMRPFLRTGQEPFEDAAARIAKYRHLDVAINGNMYDLSFLGKIGAGFGRAQAADATTPLGHVQGRGQLIGGQDEPERFYVAWRQACPAYYFGFGDPPPGAESALGGLGPILINGLKYGSKNAYREGVPAGAPASGEPDAKFRGFLEQRSNNTFASFASLGPMVGKVIIAYATGSDSLLVMVQANGTSGKTLDAIRDDLVREGFDNAVFLDGSDSAMLYANGTFYVHQGQRKNNTNTIGVGFRVK